MCGEQSPAGSESWLKIGSPPRVRGTEIGGEAVGRENRITPACAGNSQFPALDNLSISDHPRVCGEQWFAKCSTRMSTGSPPRVRGTARPGMPRRTSSRITPACAGNRRKNIFFDEARQDHPRVCGEQAGMRAQCVVSLGSPPRVRGTADFGY